MVSQVFDPDNIYDRIFTDRLDSRIKGLISNGLGNHFPSMGVIWLIERYCPKTKPWAEKWTTQAYDFLKPLTRTHLLTNGEINGSAYGFDPEYKANLPQKLSIAEFPDEVTLKVYKGQTACITWIQRSHTWDGSFYAQTVLDHDNDYALISSKKVVNAQQNEQIISINIDNLICGTMSIDGNYQYMGDSDNIHKIFKSPPPYASFPNWQNAETFGQEIQIKFPKQKKAITIEWLEKGASIKNARYCDKVNNLITCWHREERIYTAPKDKDLDAKLDSSFWLINSCVITGNGLLVGITNKQKELMLYQFLDQTLEGIYSQLRITECKVLVSCDCVPLLDNPEIEFANPTFQTVPDNYHFASLSISGENGDKGNPMSLIFEDNRVFFNNTNIMSFWDEYLESISEKNPIGYEIWDETSVIYSWAPSSIRDTPESAKVLVIPFLDIFPSVNLTLFSTVNNQPKTGGWIESRWRDGAPVIKDTSLPSFGGNVASPFRFKYQLTTGLENVRFSMEAPYPSFDKFAWKYTLLGTPGVSLYTPPSPQDCIAEFRGERIITESEEPGTVFAEVFGYFISFSPYYQTINFLPVENHLFSSGSIFLSRRETWQTSYMYNQMRWSDDGGTEIVEEARDEWNRYTENNKGLLINIDTSDVINYTFSSSVTDTEVVRLTREFRNTPLDTVNLIKVTEGDKTTTSVLSNSQAQTILSEFSASFDTKPNANNHVQITLFSPEKPVTIEFDRPFFDPDTDNGDIMPDSKRVQDIDFRLQHLCDWMGMAQQPDGSIKVYPDPYHHDDLSKLQEYQFAAFSKPPNEVNPAAIYEVITNRASTDALGNKQIKQGGFVKTFNYPQMLEQFFFDISKGLGLQESGGIQVTKGDNSGFVTYESQLAIAIDTLRTLSSVSKNVNELIVQAARQQVLSQSILAATGVRISTQHIPFNVNGKTLWAEVACIAPGSPSILDTLSNLELNTAILVGGNLSTQEVN